MKLSVVIPAYNEEVKIVHCLRAVKYSLACHDCKAEIIVVNNASTDRTRDVALQVEGVRVVDEPKKGLSQARHAGYTASQGELIAHVDADTLMTPQWVARVLHEFEKDEDLHALSGPHVYHDLSWWHRFVVKYIFYFPGYVVSKISQLFGAGSMLQGGNYVIKRSALDMINGYDTTIEFYGEDIDVARRLTKAGGKIKWTFKLPMHASGRRIKHEGFITMGIKYGLNFLTTTFLGKPATTDYIDVRPEK